MNKYEETLKVIETKLSSMTLEERRAYLDAVGFRYEREQFNAPKQHRKNSARRWSRNSCQCGRNILMQRLYAGKAKHLTIR